MHTDTAGQSLLVFALGTTHVHIDLESKMVSFRCFATKAPVCNFFVFLFEMILSCGCANCELSCGLLGHDVPC